MIGTEGQYVLSFSIESLQDFIAEDLLDRFVLVEEPGNVVPTFALSFRTTSESVIAFFNEGNTLLVSMGKEALESRVCSFVPLTVEVQDFGQSQKLVVVYGTLDCLPYLNTPITTVTDRVSGIRALSSMATEWFRTDFDPTDSKDAQNWVCASKTGRAWVFDLWLHSKLQDSVPLIYISADKTFKLRSLKSILSSPPAWRIRPFVENKLTDIACSTDTVLKTQTGLVNSWFGYGRSKVVHVMESSLKREVTSDGPSFQAIGDDLLRDETVAERADNPGVISDNTDSSYWQTYSNNLQAIALLQTVHCTVTLDAGYHKISPLDLVLFQESSVDKPENSSKEGSGLYVVGKVVRELHNRRFLTTVELHRSSITDPKGALR